MGALSNSGSLFFSKSIDQKSLSTITQSSANKIAGLGATMATTLAARGLGSIMNMSVFTTNKKRLYFTNLKIPDSDFAFPDVELWIDPNSINVSKPNIINKTLTKNGFVVQHWGHDLTTLTVNANSGYFGFSKGMVDFVLRSLPDKRFRMGSPLTIFNKLKDYVFTERYSNKRKNMGEPVIIFVYEGNAYEGYFNNFNYSLQAAQPFSINYNFTFTILDPETGNAQDSFESEAWRALKNKQTSINNPSGSKTDLSEATINSRTKFLLNKLENADAKQADAIFKYLEKVPSKVSFY